MRLDVTADENWAKVIDAAMAAHGRLDIPLTNAAVSLPGSVEEQTVAIWESGARVSRHSRASDRGTGSRRLHVAG
jgi:NAD(P)-dependent dehydrogenase (short-subunit alcohol dehydrogenase family)